MRKKKKAGSKGSPRSHTKPDRPRETSAAPPILSPVNHPAKMVMLFATAVLFLFYLLLAYLFGYGAGYWHDDSIYLSTAKSVAEGMGYRHPEIPGNPWETKYPPLYSFTLAAFFKLGGDYPANLPCLLLPGALSAAAMVVLVILYIRRVFGADWRTTLAVAFLTAISPVTISFTQVLMSELPYAFFTTAALWFADGERSKVINYQENGGRPILTAIFSSLATLARSIGITLVIAILGILAVRRKWRSVVLVCVVTIVFLAPWNLWKAHAIKENGLLQTFRLTQYNLDYSLWVPNDIFDTLRVIKQNIFKTIVGVGIYEIPWPRHWFSPQTLVVMHVISFASTMLMVTGFLVTASRGWLTVHFYALFYLALMLVWPFQPVRFLVPWTPFIFFWIIKGISFWSGRLQKSVENIKPRINFSSALFGLFCAGVFLLSVMEDNRLRVGLPERKTNLMERAAVFQWVKGNTSPNDTIACADPAILYLETGRKGYDLWPIKDPYSILYSPERSWTDFYSQHAKVEMDVIFEEMRNSLLDTYMHGNVAWVILEENVDAAAGVLSFVTKMNPQVFQPVFSSPLGKISVFRFFGPGGSFNASS